MRRVLHVNDYPPDDLGGAEVLMARTLALLRAAGWDARPFSRADLPDPKLTPLRYLNNPVARAALRRTLAEFEPGVVHLHNYYHLLSPGVLAELARYKARTRARVVMTAHDYHLVCPNSGGNWFRNGPRPVDADRLGSWRYLLGRRWDHRGRGYSALKLAQHAWHYRLGRDARRVIDLVLCPSRFLRWLVDRVGLRTAHLPLPNPPAAPTAELRPDELTLVFAGRVEPEKGLVPFLRDLPAGFAGRLRIIGEGSARAAAEMVVRERGLADRVEFLGRRPHSETLRLIAASHVVVLPSVVLENYPLSLVEALAVGTNVLTSDLGGMREIVTDSGVGYCFRPGDAGELADRLARIATAHAAGTLNAFDVSGFLSRRTEAAYLAGLERVYAGGEP